MANLLSDEEIIKELENIKKHNYTLAPDEVFDAAIRSIRRNRGEWIDGRNGYQCSECKYIPHRGEREFMNFCPNCGADMRGEEK